MTFPHLELVLEFLIKRSNTVFRSNNSGVDIDFFKQSRNCAGEINNDNNINNKTSNTIPVSEANIGVSTLNEERYIEVIKKF